MSWNTFDGFSVSRVHSFRGGKNKVTGKGSKDPRAKLVGMERSMRDIIVRLERAMRMQQRANAPKPRVRPASTSSRPKYY